MLDRVRRTFGSSIGRKLLVALSGLALLLFLIGHLAGNLLLYVDADGESFGAYARAIESSPLLPLAELLLAAVFVAHIALAVRVSLQNREARVTRYRVRAVHGGRTPGSASMIVTGLIVLVFLVVHLWDFRVQKETPEELAGMVRTRLGGVSGFLVYVVGVGALTLHLSHAFQSALQTLGLHHPRYRRLFQGAGIAIALALGLGFVSFPLVFFLGGR